jgi:acetyl/propionyl-CoA carboxylase alpha subunit
MLQDEVENKGWAVQCRGRAEDPWKQFLPSPGEVRYLRLPDGPNTRVDTYLQEGCNIPSNYDPLIAKLIAWGESREVSLQRMRQALKEFQMVGTMTNLALLQRIMEQSDFDAGQYSTESLPGQPQTESDDENYYRDLALIAALTYLRKNRMGQPSVPDRLLSGWHRESRRIAG